MRGWNNEAFFIYGAFSKNRMQTLLIKPSNWALLNTPYQNTKMGGFWTHLTKPSNWGSETCLIKTKKWGFFQTHLVKPLKRGLWNTSHQSSKVIFFFKHILSNHLFTLGLINFKKHYATRAPNLSIIYKFHLPIC